MGGNLVDNWFRVIELEPGVVQIEEPWHDEQVKSFLITGEQRALLLDAGTGVGDLRAVVDRLTRLPLTVVLSHAHWDHVGSVHQFAGDTEILIHPLAADTLRAGVSNERMRRYLAPEHQRGPFAGMDLGAEAAIPGVEPTGVLAAGQVFDLGGRRLEVLEAPGHCPDLVVLWDAASAVLFGTDAVYADALYAQAPESDLGAYLDTLERLSGLTPVPRLVCSSHGESPMSPELIPAMRDAVSLILAGRQPDAVSSGVAHHAYAGFSVLTPWPLPERGRT